jgi:hypothetical protein
MPFSVEEMTTWTADEAEAQLRKLLPEGWSLVLRQEEGWFSAYVLDGLGELQWSDWNADRRLLCLNGVGVMWLRGQKPHHPAWRPRRDNARPPTPPKADVADPPDLDPKEVQSVYGKRRDK